jgi:hypothetical protein
MDSDTWGTSCPCTPTQVVIIVQQPRVEYIHVTDHMVMHCVRLLATQGKFKVRYISHKTRTETPIFERCKPELRVLTTATPRVIIKSWYRSSSYCLPELRKQKNLTCSVLSLPYRERHWCAEMNGTLPESAAWRVKDHWLRFTLILKYAASCSLSLKQPLVSGVRTSPSSVLAAERYNKGHT